MPDSASLSDIRLAEIGLKIVEGKVKDIVNAHHLVGYALDYCRGVCPPGVCNPKPVNEAAANAVSAT